MFDRPLPLTNAYADSSEVATAVTFFFQRRLLRGILELLDHADARVRAQGAELAGKLLAAERRNTFAILPAITERLHDIRASDVDEQARQRAAWAIDQIIQGLVRAG